MLAEKEYSAVDFARMAWRRRWFIAVPFVLGVFGTLVWSSGLPELYQSEILIQVVPQRVPDSYVQSTVTLRTEERIDALAQQAMSRTELERLIETFDLYADDLDRLPMEDVIERMRRDVEVDVALGGSRAADAEAFYVRFAYRDAEISARVTGRIAAQIVAQNARDRGALSEGTKEFLEAQLAVARDRLEEQEARLELFREQHAGRLPEQLEFNTRAMQNTQLQVQAHIESLARDRDRKLMLERLYNDAQTQASARDATALTPPAGEEGQLTQAASAEGTVEHRLTLAHAGLAGLARRLKPEHPDIIRAQRLIEVLEREVARAPAEAPAAVLTPDQAARRDRLREMGAEIDSLGRRIEFKDAEDRRLRSVISEYERRIEAVPGVESEWIALSRDYGTQEEAYRDLLSKSEQARVAANLERRQVGEQFRVLDPPHVPVKPMSPNRLRISAVGTIASLLLGLALGALVEWRDSTFRTGSEIVELLALPVIAVVPYVASEADRRRQRIGGFLVAGATTIALGMCGYLFWVMELWQYIA